MGMFDRLPNFGEKFNTGDRFVLVGAEYTGEINTKHGKAESCLFTVVSRDEPKKKIKYQALGVGFARQAKEAEPGDFPRVVEIIRVPTSNDNEVKLLAPVDVEPRAFIDGEDGPPVNLDEFITSADKQGVDLDVALGVDSSDDVGF